jgi:hypothetical protein
MRNKNSVFLKLEKIKIKRAGSGMLEVKICLQTSIFHFIKSFMENLDFSFGFNNSPLPASDFLALLAELR